MTNLLRDAEGKPLIRRRTERAALVSRMAAALAVAIGEACDLDERLQLITTVLDRVMPTDQEEIDRCFAVLEKKDAIA